MPHKKSKAERRKGSKSKSKNVIENTCSFFECC